jgi:hypothetical protein
MVDQADETLTVAEAEAFTGLSRWTLNAAMNAGQLAYAQVGAHRLIERAVLARLCAQRRRQAVTKGKRPRPRKGRPKKVRAP